MKHIDEVLIEAALGENSEYYLKRFLSYQAEGLPLLSWNWAGLLFGFFWFLYRKVWAVVVPLLLIVFLAEFTHSGEITTGLRLAAVILGALLGGVFGNQIYYLWIRFLAWQGSRDGKAGKELENFLRREGGTISNSSVSSILKM